ncbi:sortase [Streptomyces sp. NPDC046324]|uniref:sortase domain-containing protein n=1 Tax=Streptomyces sp. NPDC046324 TaxID=3154915 RepID=UPI0033F0CF9C
MRTGDPIEADRADGSTAGFEVRAIQPVDKKDFPTNKVYGKTDRPELWLITCGARSGTVTAVTTSSSSPTR